ncbi:MAG: ATP-binding protein [Gammaproteobacteria bacterium]|nr:ATP-binding protein [Gammaproteobacteria bacterium]NNC66840.1 ATP-binding protein [Gammaproteobacteria bacterium]
MADNNEPSTVDVTLHIDENLSHGNLEDFRDVLLHENGVYAASFHDEKPHLMIIVYDPDVIPSLSFVKLAKEHNIHAELIGL